MKTSCRWNGVQLLNVRFPFAFALLLAALASLVGLQAQSNYATPYTFQTITGSGGNSSSLNGAGTAASFLNPTAVAVDSAGNVYVADTDNSLIRKITSAGFVSTLAGSPGVVGSTDGTGNAASFNGPQGIAVDGAGNVYVADTYNHAIRKITAAGVVTTLAGAGVDTSGSTDGTGSAASFNSPMGVAVDGAGNVYVADTYNSTIRKITPAGVVTTLAGTAETFGFADGTGSTASFSAPQGIAADSSGNIYVADTYNATIRQITPAGVVTTLAGDIYSHGSNDGTGTAAQFNLPRAVSVDSSGNIYVADSMPYGSQTSTIRVVTSAGVVTTLAGGTVGNADGLGTAAKFNDARGVAADNSGNIYVVDTTNQSVRRVTTAGLVTTWAGGIGGPGFVNGQRGAARFGRPIGLAMDNAGNVLVVDSDNRAIRQVTPAGVVTTDYVGPDYFFASTPGVAVDGSGNIYTIYNGCQVGVSSSLGGYSIFAGVGYSGSSDGPRQNASFGYPQGLAVDAVGNVYVADSQNCTIRKISTAGIVTTVAGLAGNYGSDDGPGGAARFSYPVGIALDTAGNCYVTDRGNSTVRRMTPAGVVTTLAGLAENPGSADGTGSAARFVSPSAIAVDAAGNVFVTDVGNHTIRKITPAGVVTTLGGETGFADFSTGVGPVAHFPSPTGLAVDGLGQIYVADSVYNSIVIGGLVVAPAIAAQPANQSVTETQPATFSVAATGGLLSYQWRKGGVNIAGANSPSLTLDAAAAADAGSYDVVVTNPQSSVTSSAATLAVTAIPVITSLSPARQVLAPGQTLSLSVTASGTGSLSYLWKHNGQVLPGATSSNLSISSVTNADAGWYQVLIADSHGTRPSAPIFVTVAPVTTQVRAWGNNYYGRTDIPAGLTTAVALAKGGGSIALRKNGTVVAWGDNTYGQLNLPDGLSEIVAIDSSGNYSLALKKDGTVVAWGDNGIGQTDVPAGLSGVVAISAGWYHALALKSDGTVVAWGGNDYGQSAVPAGLTGVIAIAGGGHFSLALKSDGTVVEWGINMYGIAAIPAGLSGVTRIAAGSYHALALKGDGTVVAWGGYAWGGAAAVPVGLSGAVDIAASSYSVALKSDGTVVGWADDGSGQSAPPVDLASVVFISPAMALRNGTGDTLPGITAQPVGQVKLEGQSVSFSVAATGVGPISYQWRKNGVNINDATSSLLELPNLLPGDAGNYDVLVSNYLGTTASATAALTVNALPAITSSSPARQQLTSGQTLNLSVTATGTGVLAYQWMHNGIALPGATSAVYSLSNATTAAAGWYLVTITDSFGTRRSAARFVSVSPAVTQVLAWGNNTNGQTTIPAALGNVTALSAGWQHVLALKRDGTVIGWGFDGEGQTDIPANLTDVVQVSAAGRYSFALKSDGTVVGWGLYDSTATVAVPAGLTNVVSISAGDGHVLALKDDGTVVAWGSLAYSMGQSVVPPGLTGVVQVSAGTYHSLALKNDGTVVGWGGSGFSPPAGLTGVTAISAGYDHDLALKTDGTVVAWGNGTTGLGINSVPAGLSGVVAISSGSYHSLGLKNNGTVIAWGNNSWGESTVPVGLTDVIAVSGSWYASYVLRDGSLDPLPSIGVSPANKSVAELLPVSFSVTASGPGSLVYQWRRNGTNIPGATATTLSIPHAASTDAGSYDVVVSNHVGSVTSSAAALTVNPIPVVTSLSPSRQVKTVGSALDLSVSATGTGSLSYQWIHNGLPIAGATGQNHSVPSVTRQTAGWYSVSISDSYGTRRSAPIFVVVPASLTQVLAWGAAGQSSVPAGLSDVVAVSVGNIHALALRKDGTVIGWKIDGTGPTAVPSSLTNVVAISAGIGGYSLALRSDGTVVNWIQDGTAQTPPAGLTDVVGIAAGTYYSLALKSDGTVVGWGDGDGYGVATIPSGLSNVVSLSLRYAAAIALKADGTVSTWGSGTSGATVPTGLSGVVAVSASHDSNMLALKNDNTVISWGYAGYPVVPVPAGLNGVIGISAGTGKSFAVQSNGAVVGWGNDINLTVPAYLADALALSSGPGYAVAFRDSSNDTVPAINVQPVSLTAVETLTATFSVTAAGPQPLSFQWRKNGTNITGATSSTLTLADLALSSAAAYDVMVTNHIGATLSSAATLAVNPIPVVTNLSAARQVVLPGQSLNFNITATGTGALTYQWIHNGKSIPGATGSSLLIGSAGKTDGGWYIVAVTDSVGTRRSDPFFATMAPLATQVVAWGTNFSGRTSIPAGLTNAIALAAGGNHSLALKRDGTVVAWGDNSHGQISVPNGLNGVVAIAAGGDHSLALKGDGTVVAWGTYYGYSQYTPNNLRGIVAIADTGNQSMALKSDGTVVMWGVVNGSGTTTIPAGLSGVTAVTAGGPYLVGLKTDGTLLAWYNGALVSDGPFAGRTDLLAVAGLSGHIAALTTAGTVLEWGLFYSGSATVPSGIAGAVAIAAGEDHTLALKGDGTVVGWGGYNAFGQATIPIGLGDVLSISAGTTFSLALRDAGPVTLPAFSTPPVSQAVTVGSAATFTVVASGDPAPTYQWQKNGLNISGATNNSYTIGSAGSGDAGNYSVVATNAAGSVTSTTATLMVGTPSAGFDSAGYLSRYPDVAAIFGSNTYGAWLYYHDHGIYQGEVFDELFRVDEYLVLYPELFAIFGDNLGAALDHWLSTGRIEGKLGRIPLEFSAVGYFTRNPDVATAVNNDALLAWGHYWLYGIYEGRAYDDELRVFEYLAINADLTAAFVNDWRQAALHWMRYGRTEGRLGRLPLTFSVAEYLNRSPDVAAVWGTNPTTVFLHFWLYGIDENRTYDDLFRPDEYMTRYPDVAAAVGGQRRGAFKHWVRYGLPGGRIGRYP